MNKRTLILERARLRLLEAEKTAIEEKRKLDTASAIASHIDDGKVRLFFEDGMLIIASLKNVQTLR
jgi:hypothetical protein